MGNSLHNKIYLGRRSPFASRAVQTLLALGLAAGIGMAWLLVRAWR